MASSLLTEIARLTRASEPFVYAYYDGVDKVSHEYGLGAHYDAEVAAVDRLVGDVLDGRGRREPQSSSCPTTVRSKSARTSCRSRPR